VEDVAEDINREEILTMPLVHDSWADVQIWVNSKGIRCRVDPEGWEKMDLATREAFLNDCNKVTHA
jgi:hypothetical protein